MIPSIPGLINAIKMIYWYVERIIIIYSLWNIDNSSNKELFFYY